MPEFARPLFLIPPLLTTGVRDDAVDLADTEYRTTTELAVTMSALFEQLGPLIVDLNLAGYEVTDVVAASGPTAPTVRHEVATMVATSEGPRWGTTDPAGEVYADVDPGWAGGKAAIALHVEPRLALGWGTGFRSSYGIPLGPLPAGWAPDPFPPGWSDSGGWIACALPSGTAVPGELGAALGTVLGNGPLGLLSGHVRGALVMAWNAATDTTARLRTAGLLGVFDPDAWQFAPGAVHAAELSAVFAGKVLVDRNGAPTAIAGLLEQSLAKVIDDHRGAGSSDAALAGLRNVMGKELARLFGGGISGGTATFDLSEWAPHVAGLRHAGVELMVLMEHDLLSLRARVTGEEPLPVVIDTERTDDPLTGFYHRTDWTPLTDVSLGELGVRSLQPGGDVHADDLAAIDDYSYELRTSSDTMVLNQAGDRIAGYWQQREQRSADGASVRLVQWPFEGTRDRSEPGVVYDVTWEDDPTVTQFSFVSSGPYVTVTTLWGGVAYEMERQVNRIVEFDEDDQGTVVDRASIKPHLPPELIDTLATPELRFQAEVANRAPLHPNEIDMLDAVVDAMSARIDAYLPASGVNQVLITEMMCNEFNAATEYFAMDSSSAPLGAAARDYLRFKLSRAEGGVARWYAVLDMIRPGNWPDFAERLGITRGELAKAGQPNVYQYKMRSLPLSVNGAKTAGEMLNAALDGGGRGALRTFVRGAARIAGLLDGTETPIDVNFEPIEVLFKKTGGQADPDWPPVVNDDPGTPTDESESGAVRYYGVIAGGSLGVQFGINLAFDHDWSDLETGYAIWKPDDFAGFFRTKGVDWGYLDLTVPVVNRIWRSVLGWKPVRTCGSYGYSVFDDTDDDGNMRYAWSVSGTMTNNTGLYIDLSYAELHGYICQDVDMMDPSSWLNCVQAAVSAIKPPAPATQTPLIGDTGQAAFETGRSELTTAGEASLRAFATQNLAALMAPNVLLRVDGHASPMGTPRFNDVLSYHRARNIVRYLRSHLGVTFNVWPGHIALVAYGELLADEAGAGADDPAWRRVDVFLDQSYMLRLTTGAPT